VYKLVELERDGAKRYAAKYSPDKQTLPGAKQVFRGEGCDVIACAGECGTGEALLRPTISEGRLAGPLPTAAEARDYCAHAMRLVGGGHRVEYSAELLRLAEEHNRSFA
jgi:nicotinate phosphoribosyltransferase